jgi:hypothetical protein
VIRGRARDSPVEGGVIQPTWTRCCHLSRSIGSVISRSMVTVSRGWVEFHFEQLLAVMVSYAVITSSLLFLVCRFVTQVVGGIPHRPTDTLSPAGSLSSPQLRLL